MQQPQQQQYAAGHISGVAALTKLELMFSCTSLKNMVRDGFFCGLSGVAPPSPAGVVDGGAGASARGEF